MCDSNLEARHLHVFPVDPSLTVEEAWRELCIFGHRVTFTGEPTRVETVCDGDECRLIEEVG